MEARENSEIIFDALYLQVSEQFKTKPYRKLARKAFLALKFTRSHRVFAAFGGS